MRGVLVASCAVLAASCGSSPTTPTPPSSYTLSGSLSAVNGGQPLNGTATANGTITASIANGAFLLTLPGTVQGSVALTAQGAGMIDRAVFVAAGQPRSVAFDAIALDGRFDLDFYRALARNRLESDLQPLRRWTTAPRFYLRTVDEAGAAIDPKMLDLIDATIRAVVPEWTGGILGTPIVERGTETKEGVSGYVTVKVPAPFTASRCGRSTVVQSGGWTELELRNPVCSCAGAFAARTIRHEVGHALGFYHTDRVDDLMFSAWNQTLCDAHPTARELYHAAIVYHRQPGNLDPDRDSATSAPLYRAIF